MFFNEQISKSSISNRSFDLKNLFNRESDEIDMKIYDDDPLTSKMGNLLTQEKESKLRKSQRSSKQLFPSNKKIRTSQIKNSQPEIKENSQEMQLIENYLGYHNKFKTYFKSKKFKKIYNELIKQMPQEKSYYAMYMIDKLFSLNKHIKSSLVHKETSFVDYLRSYFDSGKKLITEFYKYFLVDDELHKNTKKVNIEAANSGENEKSCNLDHYFYIIVTFLFQFAIFYRSKNMRKEAQIYYESNLKIIYEILSSSTSNSKLRRKICQYLISFGSFLIENRELIKAKKIFEMALSNCINLIGIIESKLKFSEQTKNKSMVSEHALEKYKKRTKIKMKEALGFMVAIYLNIAVIYEMQGKDYLSFLALNEVRFIEQILYKHYSIKSRVNEVMKKPKEAFDSYNEKLHVVKTYFDLEKILININDEKEMKQNPNVGIYGLETIDENNENNKSVTELFFKDSKKKKDLQKHRSEFFTNKIPLIEYDSEIDFEEREKDRDNEMGLFQYTITTKNANGSQSTSIYNHVRSPNQKRALTANINEVERREGRKLSKFCNQEIEEDLRETKKSSTIFESQNIKEIKKGLRNFTYSLKHSKLSAESLEKAGSGIEEKKETDFLDEMIDNEIQTKNYLLYGKQFVENYDLLSKGKRIQEENYKTTESENNKTINQKGIFFNQNTQFEGQKEKLAYENLTNFNLLKKEELLRNAQKSHNRHRNLSKSIVKNSNESDFFSNDAYERQSEKKKHSKSLKNVHMKYKEVVKNIENTHLKFMRNDLIDKNNIYRLKCRSQTVAKSNQAIRSVSCEPQVKTTNGFAILNLMKNENDQETLKFKVEKKDKLFQSLNSESQSNNKRTNLSKKALNSNLFTHNETGIRLFKKIILKHKKTLKILKPDLFVTFNKRETEQEEIKLVERESYLMVQYEMCEEETKARIKENMQELIMENLRKSDDNEKRAEIIHKAIGDHGKNSRISDLNVKLETTFKSNENKKEKILMVPNKNYFSNDNGIDKIKSPADQIVEKIYEQRILRNSNENDDLGLEEDIFLTGNKSNNTNLFLSSIKFKEEKKENKKVRTIKNLNNLWIKPDSEEDESSYHNAYTNNAIEIYSGNTSNEFGGTSGQIEESNNLLSDNWI